MNPDEGASLPERDAKSPGEQLSPGQYVGGGRYRLVQLLGRGGMGVVWQAQDEQFGEIIALKMLPPEIRADAVALDDLRREALKSRKLTHPHIIRIHDLFSAEGELPFISMEYVDGPNLGVLRLEQEQRLFSWEFLKPIVKQLCDALAYAHEEKVIHRDLKPGNMMLDSRGRLKLADFGIAATVTDTVNRVSLRHLNSGTPTHMSPQQVEGRMPRPSDDIYALGATLYELLTSRPPFYTGDILHQVLNVSPQPMAERLADLELANDIPSDVAALVMACLAKDPAQRPPSARAVAAWIGLDVPETSALDELASPAVEEGISGEEPSRKGWWIGLGVLGLAVVVGAGWYFTSHRKQEAALSVPPAPASNSIFAATPAPAPVPPPATLPIIATAPAASTEQWTNLFNGRDLAGWSGDSHFWSVREGVIHGEMPASSPPKTWSFLVGRNVQLGDFELRLIFRFSSGNSGIYYRTRRVGETGIEGYQFEMVAEKTGNLLQNGPDKSTRRDLASRGQHTVVREAAGGDHVDVIGTTGSTDDLQAAIKVGNWNELVIIAQGDHLIQKLNGRVMVDVTDANASRHFLSGGLAFELYGPTVIDFKDIRLRTITPAAAK